jgi:hypothetical protein
VLCYYIIYLINAKVSSRPKDTSVHLRLSSAAKEVSTAIQSLFNATQGLAPDQIKCDEALETLSEIMENLDGLALTTSVCTQKKRKKGGCEGETEESER